MLLAFLQKNEVKNLVNVAMRTEEVFYNISLDLYNKNVLDLEYAQISRNGPKSMICDTEGLSNSLYHQLFWRISFSENPLFMMMEKSALSFHLITKT